jgi:hypothetical protein
MNTEGIGVYGNDYLRRATVAFTGLGANQPQDAVYLSLLGDVDGAKLVAPSLCAGGVGGGGRVRVGLVASLCVCPGGVAHAALPPPSRGVRLGQLR